MKNVNKIVLALIAALIMLTQSAFSDDAETLKQLGEKLSHVGDYEPGDDSAPLVDVEGIVFKLPPDSPIRTKVEKMLIEALEAASTNPARGFLCEQLRVVASEAAIPALAKQLVNPEVSFLARRAVSRLDSQSVDIALLKALDETKGDLKAGIINSLADRNFQNSMSSIIPLLNDSNVAVASASARALGRFGGELAHEALIGPGRPGRQTEIRAEVVNALIGCAEKYVQSGDLPRAQMLYRRMHSSKVYPEIRLAGLRGRMLYCKADPSVLVSSFIDDEIGNAAIALSGVVQKENEELTKQICGFIETASEGQQVLLLHALKRRGDNAAAPAVMKLADSDSIEVRTAAVDALGRVGDATALSVLLSLSLEDNSTAKVARRAITKLPDVAVDSKLEQLMDDPSESLAIEAIKAFASRDPAGAAEKLMNSAESTRAGVRQAAIAAISQTVRIEQFDEFLKMSFLARSADERALFTQVISSAVARILLGDQTEKTKFALRTAEAISDAPIDAQPMLIPILCELGTKDALNMTLGCLKSQQVEISGAALFTLSQWPNSDAIEPLSQFLTEKNQSQANRDLAIAGFVRLAARQEAPYKLFVDMIGNLTNINEQKTVLSALGQSKADSPASLDAAMSFLDNQALQATSGLASLRIANRVRKRDEARAKKALLTVVTSVDNEDVKNRAQEVINDIEKYDDHILKWESVGPFTDKTRMSGETVYSTEFGPETTDEMDWKPITKGVGDWQIDLEQTYGDYDFVAAYCRTHVWSPRDMEVQLEMGVDDGIRAWVNGDSVFSQYSSGFSPRRLRAKAMLKQGWNDILVKVVDHEGGWGFCCRIRKPDGTKLNELKFETHRDLTN